MAAITYADHDLLDIVDIVEDNLMRTGRRIADEGVDALKRNIEINTPVETRLLRASMERTDIDYEMVTTDTGFAAWAWTGRVFTQVEYAPFVEYGTGLWGPRHAKYIIKPKQPGGVLRFSPYSRGAGGSVILDVVHNVTKTGPVYARFVMHPGSPGAAMFRIGATLTEHQVRTWSTRGLQEFAGVLEVVAK